MKEKFIFFIIGILVGAVITAGCFLIFKTNATTPNPNLDFRSGKGSLAPGRMQNNGEIPTNFQNENTPEENALQNKDAGMQQNGKMPEDRQMPDNMQKSDDNKEVNQKRESI